MKEKIRESMRKAPGGKILEEFEDGSIYAIHGVYAGPSKWSDGKHIYAAVDGQKVLGKDISDGSTSTANAPESLAEYLGMLRRSGILS